MPSVRQRRHVATTPRRTLETSNTVGAMCWLVARRIGFPLGFDATHVRWHELDATLVDVLVRHHAVTLAAESPDLDRLPGDVRLAVARRSRHETLLGLRHSAVLQEVTTNLRNANVDFLTIKGHAFSAAVYGNWASRGASADLDLLVSPRGVRVAEMALSEMGFEPRLDEAMAPPTTKLGRYSLWLHYERGYVSSKYGNIDLHWRPMPGDAPWNSFDRCYLTRRTVELPGGDADTLDPVMTLIVASSQGESESWRGLRRLADLWVSWLAASPVERTKARAQSAMVTRSLERLSVRWATLNSGLAEPATSLEQNLGLWRMRTGSGSWVGAAVRAPLGKWLPARRIATWTTSDTTVAQDSTR